MFLFANRSMSRVSIVKTEKILVDRIRDFFSAPSSRNCQHSESNRPKSKIPYISDHHLESFGKMKSDIINELFGYNGYTDEHGLGIAATMPLAAGRLRTFMEDYLYTWNYARAMIMIRLCEEYVKCESNGSRELTAKEFQKIYTIGWCYALAEAQVVLHDDIVDKADTRGGKTNWYRLNNYHEVTVYDSYLLSNAVRILAAKYFADQPFYYDIQKILTDISVGCQWGSTLDVLLAENTWPSENMADTFSHDMYKRRTITTGIHFLSSPLKFAMHAVNKYDEKTAAQIDEVCSTFSLLCQSYDDYLDLFGAAQQHHKPCNDADRGTRSFVTVHAFKYADERQRNTLLEHYGKNDADSNAAVREVYRQIDLQSKCEEGLKSLTQRMNDQIVNVDDEAVRNAFNLFTKALYDWHH